MDDDYSGVDDDDRGGLSGAAVIAILVLSIVVALVVLWVITITLCDRRRWLSRTSRSHRAAVVATARGFAARVTARLAAERHA
jgi:hypothetical protein